MTQKGSEVLGVAGPDLQQVTVLASHMVDFENLGNGRQPRAGVLFLLAGPGDADGNKGQLT